MRLFDGVGGDVRYIDEFETDKENPYYMTDAPETDGGPVRSVIVFRLRPMAIKPQAPSGRIHRARTTEVSEVPIEEQHTERMFVEPNREPYEAERREARLVLAFKQHLAQQGHEPIRLRVLPGGEAKPLYSDLYVPTLRLIVEAKGTVERGSVRMALGQLLDYGRFVENARCAVLLPGKPRPDIISLIHRANVELFWQNGDGFEHNVVGQLRRDNPRPIASSSGVSPRVRSW